MERTLLYLVLIWFTFMVSCNTLNKSVGPYMEYSYYEGGDRYNDFEENPFLSVEENPVSTFSIDADGASYSNMRRYISQEEAIPPKGAIRTEEFINYFNMDYPYDNQSVHPVSVNGEVSICPWNPENKLIRVGLKGRPIPENELPATNYVFLIDVSGSMSSADKLPLLKTGFRLFVDELTAHDKVAIVVYAGSSGVVLPSTPGDQKEVIKKAIDKLGAGGSTAGEAGIRKAYDIAFENFIEGGNNRIIVGTDGDFNVGIYDTDQLISLIEEKRELGIFLTMLGVGRGNLNEAMLEQLANNGNGNYEYIDKLEQLLKVFVYEKAKFHTVAKDVKVQVEFNPENVLEYRLIGYENRLLETEDFENDSTDAGEIGSGQSITALYEIKPVSNPAFRETHTFSIDFRYKEPGSNTSVPLNLNVFDQANTFAQSSNAMRMAASAASFSMLLRDSPYRGTASTATIAEWLNTVNLPDEHGFIDEFKTLVDLSERLTSN